MTEPVTCPLCGAGLETCNVHDYQCIECDFACNAFTLEKVRALAERPPRGWRLRLEAAEADAGRYRDLYETRSEYVEVLEGLRDELEARIAELQTPRVVLEAAEKLLWHGGYHVAANSARMLLSQMRYAEEQEKLRGGAHADE